MGYDLLAKNKEVDSFHFDAFSFPMLLEACGYLFPCIHNGGQWYCAFGTDERMPAGDSYPRLLSNDGFRVTAEEARIMARIARNFAAIQATLPDRNAAEDARSKAEFNRDDLSAALLRGMFGTKENWPVKIRVDFTQTFIEFADWADKSGGFAIH